MRFVSLYIAMSPEVAADPGELSGSLKEIADYIGIDDLGTLLGGDVPQDEGDRRKFKISGNAKSGAEIYVLSAYDAEELKKSVLGECKNLIDSGVKVRPVRSLSSSALREGDSGDAHLIWEGAFDTLFTGSKFIKKLIRGGYARLTRQSIVILAVRWPTFHQILSGQTGASLEGEHRERVNPDYITLGFLFLAVAIALSAASTIARVLSINMGILMLDTVTRSSILFTGAGISIIIAFSLFLESSLRWKLFVPAVIFVAFTIVSLLFLSGRSYVDYAISVLIFISIYASLKVAIIFLIPFFLARRLHRIILYIAVAIAFAYVIGSVWVMLSVGGKLTYASYGNLVPASSILAFRIPYIGFSGSIPLSYTLLPIFVSSFLFALVYVWMAVRFPLSSQTTLQADLPSP